METFALEGHDFIELHRLLKVKGLCSSGGEAKQQIAAGLVKVDGTVELRKRCKVRSGQMVTYAGRTLAVT